MYAQGSLDQVDHQIKTTLIGTGVEDTKNTQTLLTILMSVFVEHFFLNTPIHLYQSWQLLKH